MTIQELKTDKANLALLINKEIDKFLIKYASDGVKINNIYLNRRETEFANGDKSYFYYVEIQTEIE